jgi:hypothetical protein
MTNEAGRHSPRRRMAIVLGVAGVLVAGLVIGAFALGGAMGNVWGGIITQTGTGGSSGIQRLPAGSVVMLQGTVVAHLETVRTIGAASSARVALYAGRWVLEDPDSVKAASGYSAEVISADELAGPVVIQLVRRPRTHLRAGELRLNPFVQAIPVYQSGALGKRGE